MWGKGRSRVAPAAFSCYSPRLSPQGWGSAEDPWVLRSGHRRAHRSRVFFADLSLLI